MNEQLRDALAKLANVVQEIIVAENCRSLSHDAAQRLSDELVEIRRMISV